MLHALLHHKLDETIPEPERFEDALTSTIFGTLIMVEASDVLAQWLGRAKRDDGSREPVQCGRIGGVWFWPQLALAEPDLVIQLGDQLFIIEAKFRSGRHDATNQTVDGVHDDEDIADQLHRQWDSVKGKSASIAQYPQDLQQAITSSQVTLIFLIDARRSRRAEREFNESAGRLPEDADLRLLTWQSLYEIICTSDLIDRSSRWAGALRTYLDETGLQGFIGLRRSLPTADFNFKPVWHWKCGSAFGSRLDLARTVAVSPSNFDAAGAWRLQGSGTRTHQLADDWLSGCFVSPRELSAAREWRSAAALPSDGQTQYQEDDDG